jgi:hypothetical protein
MRPLRSLIVTAAASAAAASLVVAGPASARTIVFHDRTGDTDAPSDITRVVVDNATHGSRVIVTARMGNMIAGDSATLWLDTAPRNAGPEYTLRIYPESDGFALRRVGTFAARGHAVRCTGLRAHALTGFHVTDRFSVPRACLRHPGKVRVAIKGRYQYATRIVTDWAPRHHHFFGWVRRG